MAATSPESDTVVVDGVTIRYRTSGDGPPVVFVHGVYVGGAAVGRGRGTPRRAAVHHADVALGRNAIRHPTLISGARDRGERIPAFLEALDLHDVTLVGNDTGGGLCLAALGSGHPGLERISRLVLTNCDSYEHFPPKGFDRIAGMARRFPPRAPACCECSRTKPGQRMFLKSVCTSPPTGDAARRVFEAFPDSKGARAMHCASPSRSSRR